MNGTNDRCQSFHVFPRLRISKRQKFSARSALFSRGIKLRSLSEFYRTIKTALTRLTPDERTAPPAVLRGCPQIGRYLNVSEAVVRLRLIDEGLPVTIRGHAFTAITREIDEWTRTHRTDWRVGRNRLGRFLPLSAYNRSVNRISKPAK